MFGTHPGETIMNMTDAISLGIKSLEGETVFPKEAKDAATLLRALLIQGRHREESETDSSPGKEALLQMFSKHLQSMGVDENDAEGLRVIMRTVPIESVQKSAAQFHERLVAAGLDPNAVQAEITAAMAKDGLLGAKTVLERIRTQLEAPEGQPDQKDDQS
jgi:hypothetical protein